MRDLRQLLEETGRTAEDREMTELIQYDLQQTRNRRAELQQQVLQQLLSQDSAKMDSRNAILEVRFQTTMWESHQSVIGLTHARVSKYVFVGGTARAIANPFHPLQSGKQGCS